MLNDNSNWLEIFHMKYNHSFIIGCDVLNIRVFITSNRMCIFRTIEAIVRV